MAQKQKITRGGSFPTDPVDGDFHVLTSVANLPMYQYQVDNWVQVCGNTIDDINWDLPQ